MKDGIIIVKTNKAELQYVRTRIKGTYRSVYLFKSILSNETLVYVEILPTGYETYLLSSIDWDKSSKKPKSEWNKMFIKKQKLINECYLQMSKDKRFIASNFIRYNSRYKNTFNYFAVLVSYNFLDSKHIFLRLMYSNVFNRSWKYFIENYNNLEPYLKESITERQMLISFVVKFAKINKL